MAEPFWSQAGAVNDEVSAQEDVSVSSVPQALERIGEEVIDGPVWVLVLGLVVLSFTLMAPIALIVGIVLTIKGYMVYNKVVVISWDTVSYHLNVEFANRKLEGRENFFSYEMKPGDDLRFESYTHDSGDDSSDATAYWLEVHRRDGTVVVNTPEFSFDYWLKLRPILLQYQEKVNADAKQNEVDSVQASPSDEES